MSKTPRILFAGLLASTMLVTPTLAANVPDGTKLAADQTFTYRVLDAFVTFDPQLSEDVSSSDVERNLFEGLLSQDADGNIIPGVAASYDVSDDKMTYTFHLRPEAVWSNGDPVTASDFVFAWQRLVDPATASPYSWYGELMSVVNAGDIVAGKMDPAELGVKAVDDHTFEVKLSAPLPYFPQMVTLASTFPVPQAVVEKLGKDWTKPGNMVSNGAYTLAEDVPGERTVLVRNPKYWDNDKTVIEKIVALVINDENVALTRYLSGELDRTDVPSGQLPKLQGEYPDQVIVAPRLCTYYYDLNLGENGPDYLKDVKVREALSLAIDRQVIADKVIKGGQIPAYTFTPAATAGFKVPDVPAASMSQEERDAKAKALMAEAGYPDGLPVKLMYNTSEGHKKIAIAISQMWKTKLGVQTELTNQEWKTFLETRKSGDYEVARDGWCGDYNEASTFLDLLNSKSSQNNSKYNNPEVDALLADSKTSDDPQADYTKIEQFIATDVPIIPIYHYTVNMMLKPTVKGWPVHNVQQNWYAKDFYITAE